MKAVRLRAYREPPTVDEVAEPELTGPHDVIVRVGGAGLCRTDLHMRDGWFVDVVPVSLPLTLGHETAGWVHAVGSAVEHVAVGDIVICHPNISCGTCAACQAGQTMRCVKGLDFPGITRDGGFAELVKTAARAVLPLDPRVEPADVAALADGGLSAYHAVRKQLPILEPGSRVVVIGAGGLGHIGIQCLVALTSAEIIAVDRNPEALKLAEQCGADHRVEADGGQVERVRELTGGTGAEAVLDFVGEDDAGSIEASFGPEVIGRAVFEWVLGGQFLMERSEVPDVPEAPDGIAIIGVDRTGEAYTQHYFDSRGVARVYAMTFRDGVWTLLRDAPDFTPLDFWQRFTGEFSADGGTISGRWETSQDGSTWEHDFDLTYRKVT